jgi:hypothetical protein
LRLDNGNADATRSAVDRNAFDVVQGKMGDREFLLNPCEPDFLGTGCEVAAAATMLGEVESEISALSTLHDT